MPLILDLLMIFLMRQKFVSSFSKFLEQSTLPMDRYLTDICCTKWAVGLVESPSFIFHAKHHLQFDQTLVNMP